MRVKTIDAKLSKYRSKEHRHFEIANVSRAKWLGQVEKKMNNRYERNDARVVTTLDNY